MGKILLQICMSSATQIRIPFALGKPLKSGGKVVHGNKMFLVPDLSCLRFRVTQQDLAQ